MYFPKTTDIIHLKKFGEYKLSFIDLDDETLSMDVDYCTAFSGNEDLFSSREKDILKLLCEGATSAVIAEKLFISEHTVKTHRKNILRKTTAKSTTELVAMAIKQGWL